MATKHKEPWQGMLTEEQRRTLNAACGDLARCLTWFGHRLSKDDFRHLIAGTILGWRIMPGINRGEGAPGFVVLGGSSLDLNKKQCSEALELVFALGDAPWEYEPSQTKPVAWCDAVMFARGFQPSDFKEAA